VRPARASLWRRVMREFGVQVASLSETIRRLDKSTGRMFLVASIRGGDVEDDST
jgi:hypothetical protein